MKLRARDESRRSDHVTVRLDPEQAQQLREAAATNERSISAELRIALRQYLKRRDAA
jgi:predicted transcriptional regulator